MTSVCSTLLASVLLLSAQYACISTRDSDELILRD